MAPHRYIFLGLNAVRVLSIISLLLVFASSIFVLVTDIEAVNHFISAKQSDTPSNSTLDATDFAENCDYIEGSTVPNQPAGVFWAVVNRLLIIFQVIILIFSEVSWPAVFFDRFFPVLGPSFGLGALGIFQCLIGATILSHHVDDFTLVAAFLLFSLGCLNSLLGLIFRASAKPKRSIRAWRQNKELGVLPTTSWDGHPTFTSAPPSFVARSFTGNSGASHNEKQGEAGEFGTWKNEKAGYGFGRQGEKAAGLRGFLLTKPVESLPRYATRPTSTHSAGSKHTAGASRPASIRSEGSSRSEHDEHDHHSEAGSDTMKTHAVPVFQSSSTAI